jgi:hypothetical protein
MFRSIDGSELCVFIIGTTLQICETPRNEAVKFERMSAYLNIEQS